MGIETAALLTYAAIGTTALSVGTQLYQANQQSKMADYQRDQAQADADTAASEAQVQARQIRTAADRQRATARAALASSGVTVGEGTAEQIDQTINSRGEQDALATIYQGNTRAKQISTAGNIAGMQSDNAATASLINAGTTALNGFSTAAKGWNIKAK